MTQKSKECNDSINETTSIKQILTSEKLEQDKTKQLQALYQLYKQKMKNELIPLFDKEIYTLINSNIKDCSSEFEFSILNLLELALQFNSSKPLIYDQQLNILKTPIYDDFRNSGLILKIKSIIIQKFKAYQQDQLKSYSNILQILVSVYLLALVGQIIDQSTLRYASSIISMNIFISIKFFQENQHKQTNESNDIINDKNLLKNKNNIQYLIRILESIKLTVENNNFNYKFLINKLEIHKQLIHFLHLNCPSDLNCQSNFSITTIPIELQLLQQVALGILISLSKANIEIFEYIFKENNLLQHLPSLIHSKQIISKYLSMLQTKFKQNDDYFEFAANSPNFFHNLIIWSRYNIRVHINTVEDIQSGSLRSESKQLLFMLSSKYNPVVYQQFSNAGYMKAQAQASAISQGYSAENNIEILNTLYNIRNFFSSLFLINNYKEQSQFSFQAQLIIIKSTTEQLEEEGGNEELEAELANKELYGLIQKTAKQAKDFIINTNKHYTN